MCWREQQLWLEFVRYVNVCYGGKCLTLSGLLGSELLPELVNDLLRSNLGSVSKIIDISSTGRGRTR